MIGDNPVVTSEITTGDIDQLLSQLIRQPLPTFSLKPGSMPGISSELFINAHTENQDPSSAFYWITSDTVYTPSSSSKPYCTTNTVIKNRLKGMKKILHISCSLML